MPLVVEPEGQNEAGGTDLTLEMLNVHLRLPPDWHGPPQCIMRLFKMVPVSSDRATCSTCHVTFWDLTRHSCISCLHLKLLQLSGTGHSFLEQPGRSDDAVNLHPAPGGPRPDIRRVLPICFRESFGMVESGSRATCPGCSQTFRIMQGSCFWCLHCQRFPDCPCLQI